jgi:hypothetical protein
MIHVTHLITGMAHNVNTESQNTSSSEYCEFVFQTMKFHISLSCKTLSRSSFQNVPRLSNLDDALHSESIYFSYLTQSSIHSAKEFANSDSFVNDFNHQNHLIKFVNLLDLITLLAFISASHIQTIFSHIDIYLAAFDVSHIHLITFHILVNDNAFVAVPHTQSGDHSVAISTIHSQYSSVKFVILSYHSDKFHHALSNTNSLDSHSIDNVVLFDNAHSIHNGLDMKSLAKLPIELLLLFSSILISPICLNHHASVFSTVCAINHIQYDIHCVAKYHAYLYEFLVFHNIISLICDSI